MTLLLVGGGHAMIPLLVASAAHVHAGVAVTLLSDRPRLWYSGMVPEWLGGVYTRDDVTVDLEAMCRRAGVRFVVDRADGLDAAGQTVTTAAGERFGYDLVAVDVGATNPAPEAAGPAFRTKPLHGVEALGDWLDALAADSGGDETAARAHLAVVGGGAAGVEVALNVTARRDVAGRLSLTLVEPGERLAGTLPPRIGAWAAERLRARGATVRLGAAVDRADDAGVVLRSGERIQADAVLWATGSVGPPLFEASGLEVTERGWARVEPSMRAVGQPRVFVGGDAASVAGHEGLPKIGVHAVRHGPVIRENVGRSLDALRRGEPLDALRLRAFRPVPVAPLVISTGEPIAWWTAGPVALLGRPLLRLKHGVDRRWIERSRAAPLSAGSTWDARAAAAPGRG